MHAQDIRMRITILDDWTNSVRNLKCFSKLAGHDVQIWTDSAVDEDTLIRRLVATEVIVLIRERTHIGQRVIAALPALRLISLCGPASHIDLEGCRSADVLVTSATRASKPSFATAELTWALILAAARYLPDQIAALKEGRWQTSLGRTLQGRRLGILGFNDIGQLTACYGVAFGMSINVWGSQAGRSHARMAGYTVPDTRSAFFCGSDVVSIHLCLPGGSMHSVTAEDLAGMGPDSILVNTSGSTILEAHTLLAALQTGRPGLAAIDLFDRDPTDPALEPLLSHPRVIATPHLGYATTDEFEDCLAVVFDQVLAYARGSPINIIT